MTNIVKKLIELYKITFWSNEKIAKRSGVKLGKGCQIFINYFGSEPYLIEIGDHVQITSGVRLFTHGGGWILRHKYPLMDTFGKIKIGNNVYIGNCALILPGVTIGDNVIIGAGSVVTKSVESGMIVAGNPARAVGNINGYELKLLKYNVDSSKMGDKEKKKILLSLPDEKFIKK